MASRQDRPGVVSVAGTIVLLLALASGALLASRIYSDPAAHWQHLLPLVVYPVLKIALVLVCGIGLFVGKQWARWLGIAILVFLPAASLVQEIAVVRGTWIADSSGIDPSSVPYRMGRWISLGAFVIGFGWISVRLAVDGAVKQFFTRASEGSPTRRYRQPR